MEVRVVLIDHLNGRSVIGVYAEHDKAVQAIKEDAANRGFLEELDRYDILVFNVQ